MEKRKMVARAVGVSAVCGKLLSTFVYNMRYTSYSLNDTKKIAEQAIAEISSTFSNTKRTTATVVALQGDLGSGKTTFVQCVARSLGVTTHITSPTFLIIKTYKLKTKNYKLLYHLDAYRLKSGDELLKLGWQELISNPKNLIFIEWPERVSEILPPDSLKLHFEFVNETTRAIEIE